MSEATVPAKENVSIQDEIARLEEEIHKISNKLQNEGFIARVPAAMIEKEQKKLAKCEKQQKALKAQITQ